MGTYLIMPFHPERAAFESFVTIEGVIYRFDYVWHDRLRNWYMSVSEEGGSPIVSQVKMMWGWPVLYRYKYLDGLRFSGDFYIFGGDAEDVRIDKLEMGTRFKFYYFDAEAIREQGGRGFTISPERVRIPS